VPLSPTSEYILVFRSHCVWLWWT